MARDRARNLLPFRTTPKVSLRGCRQTVIAEGWSPSLTVQENPFYDSVREWRQSRLKTGLGRVIQCYSIHSCSGFTAIFTPASKGRINIFLLQTELNNSLMKQMNQHILCIVKRHSLAFYFYRVVEKVLT